MAALVSGVSSSSSDLLPFPRVRYCTYTKNTYVPIYLPTEHHHHRHRRNGNNYFFACSASVSQQKTNMISAIRTSAIRAATRRPMSTTVAPKMHKAKDAWGELKKTRPPPGHDHVSIKLYFRFSTTRRRQFIIVDGQNMLPLCRASARCSR